MAERTTVARLRVRASPQGSAATPARVAALLAGSDLRPRRLPSGALLCVRRLEDPAPGTLRLGTHSLRPSERWRELVVDSLDEALRRAARPALTAVPAGADSVLFADRAELLAALAREWCDGTAHTRWWWSLVTVETPSAAAVPRAWLESADAAPVALELLARDGRAGPFARRLDDAQATAIALAVAERHGLREVVLVLQQLSQAHAVPTGEGASAADAAAVAEEAQDLRSLDLAGTTAGPRPASVARATAPWTSIVPEAGDTALAPAQRLLLLVLLVVRRRLPLARERRFARALVRVATERGYAVTTEPPPGDASHIRPPVAAQEPKHAPAADDGSADTRSPPPAVAPERASARRRDTLGSPAAPGATTSDDTSAPAVTPRAADARAEPSATAAQDGPSPLPEDTAVPVRTGLGGLFMLVNAAIALELYADFTSPLRPGIRLDPWHFVTLAGRRLLGPAGCRAHRTDPVWDLLSELGGNRRLGAAFRPPAAWRMEPEWLEAFADDERPWRAGFADGRLRVQHPAGFAVLDVAAGSNEERRIGRALARYGSPPWEPWRPPRPAARTPLECWLDRLVPYLAARLHVALGGEAAERLLPIPALIRTTPERIDVEIPLSRLPVEVRIAGLDRDPGWFPAAGRTIAFHFE